jgi:hypothetical protein
MNGHAHTPVNEPHLDIHLFIFKEEVKEEGVPYALISRKVVRLATCATPAHKFDPAIILGVEIAFLSPMQISWGLRVSSPACLPSHTLVGHSARKEREDIFVWCVGLDVERN